MLKVRVALLQSRKIRVKNIDVREKVKFTNKISPQIYLQWNAYQLIAYFAFSCISRGCSICHPNVTEVLDFCEVALLVLFVVVCNFEQIAGFLETPG